MLLHVVTCCYMLLHVVACCCMLLHVVFMWSGQTRRTFCHVSPTSKLNKVVKRFKLFLLMKCCLLLSEKFALFDWGFRSSFEIPAVFGLFGDFPMSMVSDGGCQSLKSLFTS